MDSSKFFNNKQEIEESDLEDLEYNFPSALRSAIFLNRNLPEEECAELIQANKYRKLYVLRKLVKRGKLTDVALIYKQSLNGAVIDDIIMKENLSIIDKNSSKEQDGQFYKTVEPLGKFHYSIIKESFEKECIPLRNKIGVLLLSTKKIENPLNILPRELIHLILSYSHPFAPQKKYCRE